MKPNPFENSSFKEYYEKNYKVIKCKIPEKYRKPDTSNLEARFKKAGWKKLDWLPTTPECKKYKWALWGTPPYYRGEMEDYREDAAWTMCDDKGFETGYVLVRRSLKKAFTKK